MRGHVGEHAGLGRDVEHVDDAILKRYLQRMTLESQRAIWDMSMFNLVNISAVRRTPLRPSCPGCMGAERTVGGRGLGAPARGS